MSLASRIYERLPVWMQNASISAYGIAWRHRRYGGKFRTYVDEFSKRERFSSSEWLKYQSGELARLIVYATAHVPYYKNTLAQIEVPQDVAALPALPTVSKDAVRRHPDGFLSDEVPARRLHAYHTSGTTGTPLQIKMSSDTHRRWSAAYEVRVRRWAGVHHKLSRAMIGGRIVLRGDNPPFWRFNLAERQLYLSAFHISKKNAPAYVKMLNRFQPRYLVGYASSHFFLARFISELGLEAYQPRAVLLSSEKLTPEMRSQIEAVYRCPVFDAYSGVECCCLASECEHHRLHVSPDVGIIEILDERGGIAPVGTVGEIVATGFLNPAQPLIRYRTGDLGALSADPCPCGRQMPVLNEIVGRLEDTVVGQDGQETVRFHGIFVGIPHIVRGQVVQESLTRFRLRLVTETGFGRQERQAILARFRERLGNVDVEFELVDEIEQSERGKFRAVISKVNRSTADRSA